jgi:hypothetical protein
MMDAWLRWCCTDRAGAVTPLCLTLPIYLPVASITCVMLLQVCSNNGMCYDYHPDHVSDYNQYITYMDPELCNCTWPGEADMSWICCLPQTPNYWHPHWPPLPALLLLGLCMPTVQRLHTAGSMH